ncbi:MAG: hypothetical protein H6828_14985 [Planctomycetes bacterium]|nr:hypothetical protein [Planctomycetota bacterium]
MPRPHFAALCLPLVACASAPVTVEGFYDGRTLASLDEQASPDLRDVESKRGGLRVGVADPEGYYRIYLQAFAEDVDLRAAEGPIDLRGGGAGFGVSGRRVLGVFPRESAWLLPYRFEANSVTLRGSSTPAPGVEYERWTFGEASFDLGLGRELGALLVMAGWSVSFHQGRLDADLSGTPRRHTTEGWNQGPWFALELGYVEDRPVRVVLRVGLGDLEQVALSAGVGF